MLDFDVSKMAVIGVVALIVLGPERLPTVSRTIGTMFGRAQRYFAEVKEEVGRQIELDEVRKLKSEIQGAVQGVSTSLQSGLTQTVSQLKAEVGQTASALEQALSPDSYLPSIHDRAISLGADSQAAAGSSWSASISQAAVETRSSPVKPARALRGNPVKAGVPARSAVRRSAARSAYGAASSRNGRKLLSSSARRAASRASAQTA